MKRLRVTKTIPPQAAVLLIDMESSYLEELIEHLEEPEREQMRKQIKKRLDRMVMRLGKEKAKGSVILSSASSPVIPLFQDVIDREVPMWWSGQIRTEDGLDEAEAFPPNPEFLESVQQEPKVVVCGLWKESCVYTAARHLQDRYGDRVLLLDDDELSLEFGLSLLRGQEELGLAAVCEQDGVKLILA